MGCGIETEANSLMAQLTSGVDFTIPVIDLTQPQYQLPNSVGSKLYEAITPITNSDLTTGVVGGSGTFDVLMQGIAALLQQEFDKNRITGAEYAKAFIALTEGAMQNATAFLLGKDKAYWDAANAQIGAITASVNLETAKLQAAMMGINANTAQANYALTKAKLSTESANYCIAKFQLDEMLPAQKALVVEQTEAAHAQTSNVRLDGITDVTGVLGKQRELYDQQITSYKRDSEIKVGRLYVDSWVTQKTIDEGVLPPDEFTNANINEVLIKLRDNNNLD